MRFREALATLKQRKVTRFALVGNEPFLKDLFIETVKATFSSAPFLVYHDNGIEEAKNALTPDSLFGFKSIILKRFDKHLKLIQQFVEDNSTDTIVIELSEKANLKSKDITLMLGQCAPVECVKMREYGTDYPTWISTRISEEGFQSEDGVDEAVFQKVGASLYAIENELQKLFIYRQSSKFILLKDVSNVVSQRALSTAYQILEFLLKRDITNALLSFEVYSQVNENPIELVMFLEHYLEKVYRMILLHEQRLPPDGIAEIIGLPRFLVKTKYLPRALSLGKQFVSERLASVIDLDVRLRKSPHSPKTMVESWLYRFA